MKIKDLKLTQTTIPQVSVILTLMAFGFAGCSQLTSSSTSVSQPHSDPSRTKNPSSQQSNSLSLAQETLTQETRVELYKQASPAVIAIDTGESNGSGFIVTADGLVLTNAHVIADATSPVTVILADGTELEADILGVANEDLDLAAIQIRNQSNLPTLPLASPGSAQVGQSVYAIGTPYDIEYRNTFTTGIISGIRAQGTLIQHDAAVNPGNSGGPLLNSEGEVIGVNTAILTAPVVREGQGVGRSLGNVGISFALAIDVVEPFLVAAQQGELPRVAQKPQLSQPSQEIQAFSLPLNGQLLQGRLEQGDEVLPNNSYFELYAFEGRAGQQVTIEMKSEEIDPALLLFSPQQEKLIDDNDDISPQNFNAKLTTTLPSDGVYFVLASAFERGETGRYQIQATSR